MPTAYYTNCRCPYCQHKLDEVAETVLSCPLCNRPLDRRDVWATRKYPGHVILPKWVAAFTWPLLLIVVGVASLPITLAWERIGRSPPGTLSYVLIAFGVVYFFIKFNGYDD